MTLPNLARLSEAGEVAFFDPFALHARLDFGLWDRAAFAANLPVLVHEYTHYLQSVSTVYGLYRVLDWIRTGVRLASVLPSLVDIRIPLRQWRKQGDCPEPLRVQLAEIEMRLGLNVDLEQPVPVWDATHEELGPLRICKVKFSDGEPHIMAIVPMGDDMAIPIGARALAEGMAASVQRIWEADPRIDATLAALEPEVAGWYTATRTVIRDIIGTDEDVDWINAFACDAAMMTRNPPASFIAVAAALIDSKATSRDAAATAVNEALEELVKQETADTRQDIAGVLGRLGDSDEPFARSVGRLLIACDQLLERRSAAAPFPTNVLCGDDFAELLPLLQKYPLPCYFKGTTFLSWHGDEVLERLGEELLMMEHVMRILLYGPEKGSACPLTESSSCGAPKTILCGTAPWRINVDNDGMICAFGRAMATFGALGKVIV